MAVVYLIPALLDEEGWDSLPASIVDAISDCPVFFTENERTTRRFIKQLWKIRRPEENFVIDDREWFNMAADNQGYDPIPAFRKKIKEGKNIGIISEAGCPGIADPGQALIAIAQEMNSVIKPLVGPNSILLALMASGMNGQQFRFNGYLPIDNLQRTKAIKELEAESKKKNCTELFIETPYRNNQLLEAIIKSCQPTTQLCIAVDLTGKNESVRTRTIAEWAKEKTDYHKRPAIFLIYSGE